MYVATPDRRLSRHAQRRLVGLHCEQHISCDGVNWSLQYIMHVDSVVHTPRWLHAGLTECCRIVTIAIAVGPAADSTQYGGVWVLSPCVCQASVRFAVEGRSFDHHCIA